MTLVFVALLALLIVVGIVHDTIYAQPEQLAWKPNCTEAAQYVYQYCLVQVGGGIGTGNVMTAGQKAAEEQCRKLSLKTLANCEGHE